MPIRFEQYVCGTQRSRVAYSSSIVGYCMYCWTFMFGIFLMQVPYHLSFFLSSLFLSICRVNIGVGTGGCTWDMYPQLTVRGTSHVFAPPPLVTRIAASIY